MSLVTQTVTLSGDHHFGRRLPPQALGHALTAISTVVRQSVSMAFRGRSVPGRPHPRWLEAATDLRFIGYNGEDETILVFEAPTLGEAAPELYEPRESWPTRPDPGDTGLDLLGDVVRDVAARNEDSDRFDESLLGNLAGFKNILGGYFREIRLAMHRQQSSMEPPVISSEVTLTAQQLRAATPPPQRVRVVGTLDMVCATTQGFALHLDDGQEVRGVVVSGSVGDAAANLDRRVLVLGRAIYRASGRLLRVDADQITAAGDESTLWSRVPHPRRRKLDLAQYRKPQGPTSGMSAILGRWPGDETDEEIQEALERLS